MRPEGDLLSLTLWASDLGALGPAGLAPSGKTEGTALCNGGRSSTRVSTSPNGDVVSMVSGANRITYRYDEEHRLVEAQMASGDPVTVTYDGGGNLVSIVQGATTQKTLTYQGRLLQTRDSSDVLQDRLFWVGGNLMRVNIDAAARNQAWDMRGSNTLSYQTDGTMDKARMWDNWGLEVFAAGAGSAPDVGFLSNFDLGASGLSITPQNNAWWAELGRSVEGGWRPRFYCPGEEEQDGPSLYPCLKCLCCDFDECVEVPCYRERDSAGNCSQPCDDVCGGTTKGCSVAACYEEGKVGTCRNVGPLFCYIHPITRVLTCENGPPKVCDEKQKRGILSCPLEGGVGREVSEECLDCLEGQTGKDPCDGAASLKDAVCDYYTKLCDKQRSRGNPTPWSCAQKIVTCMVRSAPECETLRSCIYECYYRPEQGGLCNYGPIPGPLCEICCADLYGGHGC